VVMEATMFVVAEPSAQRALLFVPSGAEWLLTSFALALSALVVLGGRLSERWGSRVALYVGLVGFAAASALGATAQDFIMLLSAIVLQGVFCALLAPAALSALSATFLRSQRAREGLCRLRRHRRLGSPAGSRVERRADSMGLVALVLLD